MKAQNWSINGLSAELGLDRRTIAKRLENVQPAEGKGRTARYRMTDVVGAIFAAEGGGRGDQDAPDLTHESARLKRAQADKTELEIDVLKGTLIPAEVVLEKWQNFAVSCRAKIVAIPSTAAVRVVGLTVREIELELRELLHQALDELKDYDASDYKPRSGGEADQGDGEDVGAASEPDRERVGRRKPNAKPRVKRGTRPLAD